jgi:polyhydroxybutyrate depolymerase
MNKLMIVMFLGLSLVFDSVKAQNNLPQVVNNKFKLDGLNRFVGETIPHKINVNGRERKFIEYFSGEKDYNKKDLLIVLHGGGRTAENISNQTYFTDIAKSNDLLVVFPNAIERIWEDGRKGFESTKDIDFINKIADKYKKLGVKKTMVVGVSSGGILALRMACENVSEINYFGSIAASLPEGIKCNNNIGNNVIMINGTDDNFVRWEGGEIQRYNKKTEGRIFSVEESLRLLGLNNKCVLGKVSSLDVNFSDKSYIEKQQFKCKTGSLLLFKVEGGGHSIPGGKERATLSNPIGNTNRDISAEKEIVEFLKNSIPSKMVK